jgi:dihydrodipicolinate synthase/N-acetylneuraminate lyase
MFRGHRSGRKSDVWISTIAAGGGQGGIAGASNLLPTEHTEHSETDAHPLFTAAKTTVER